MRPAPPASAASSTSRPTRSTATSTSRFEADETFPLKPSSPYAASKAASDLLALAYVRTYHLPVIVTRASNNYGPYQFPEKLIPLMISNALEGSPLPIYGDGLQVRDWLYVDDHCRAILAVLERGTIGEVYNIAGACHLPNIEVVKQLLKIVGASETLITPRDRSARATTAATLCAATRSPVRPASSPRCSSRTAWRAPSSGTRRTRTGPRASAQGCIATITSRTTRGAVRLPTAGRAAAGPSSHPLPGLTA